MVSTDVPFTILFIILYFSTLSVTHMLQSMNYLYCFLLRVIKINCVYFCTVTGCIRVDKMREYRQRRKRIKQVLEWKMGASEEKPKRNP